MCVGRQPPARLRSRRLTQRRHEVPLGLGSMSEPALLPLLPLGPPEGLAAGSGAAAEREVVVERGRR